MGIGINLCGTVYTDTQSLGTLPHLSITADFAVCTTRIRDWLWKRPFSEADWEFQSTGSNASKLHTL